MKALILAAGFGTRLRPLTYKTPKPMITVGDRPVISHVIDHLQHYGIKQIVVNVHYMADQIMNHVGTEALYFYESKGPLGTARTVYEIAHSGWLEESELFFVVNGDTITNVNLNQMVLGMNHNPLFYVKKRCGGTMLFRADHIDSRFLKSDTIDEAVRDDYDCFLDPDSVYFDIGTEKKLQKVRSFFDEKSISSLSEL